MTRRSLPHGVPCHPRRSALLVLVGALLLSLLGSSLSSASALSLIGVLRPYMASQARCTAQSVAVTTSATSGTSSSITVSNLDAAGCAGASLAVTVYDPAVTPWSSAKRFEVTSTVTAAAVTLNSSTATFTPTSALKVYVTVNGWPLTATWTYTPPLSTDNTCEVRNADGTTDRSKLCDVVVSGKNKPPSNFWVTNGSGFGNFTAYFSAPAMLASQFVAFQLTIPGTPSGWSWSNAGLTGANNGGQVTSSCSSLPTFNGRLDANIGNTPNLFVKFVENRSGTAGIICSVP